MNRWCLFCCLIILSGACWDAQRSANNGATQPDEKQPVARNGITVEAEGLPNEVKEALAAQFPKILERAITSAVNQGIAELFEKLRITDDVERGVFAALDEIKEPDEAQDCWAIYLLRPGSGQRLPETIVILWDGKPMLRFCRVVAPVQRPVAIVARHWIADGCVHQSEVYLEYHEGGKWEARRPKEKSERLSP